MPMEEREQTRGQYDFNGPLYHHYMPRFAIPKAMCFWIETARIVLRDCVFSRAISIRQIL